MEVLDKLGITEQMKDKLVPSSGNTFHATRVVSGEADSRCRPSRNPLHPRRDFLPYPAVFQRTIVFLGGVTTASKELEAAKSYLAFLTGPSAMTAIKAHCLTPG